MVHLYLFWLIATPGSGTINPGDKSIFSFIGKNSGLESDFYLQIYYKLVRINTEHWDST